MKDYASMSDVDVARMVSAYLWGSVYSLDGVVLHSETSDPFDPCNNPADAWAIMMANNIGIEKDFDFCCGECGSYYDTGLWIASAADRDLEVKHRSALRAAMIVFLMMKEGE